MKNKFNFRKTTLGIILVASTLAGIEQCTPKETKNERIIEFQRNLTGYEEGYKFGVKTTEYYLKQLPNYDTIKFKGWEGGYEEQSMWSQMIDYLKENYIHKDSCELFQ